MSLYFAIITLMCSFAVITAGIILGFMHYQKNLLAKQKEMHRLDLQYKQDLLSTSIRSAEDERTRIAKDIHDEVGSIFSTLALSINRIVPAAGSDPEHYSNSKNLVETGIASVRRISHAITPFEIRLLGLEQTLDHHFDTMATASGIDIDFESRVQLEHLHEDTALGFYRIVQELSTNCMKYASAGRMWLSFDYDEPKQQVILSYRDDGQGADPEKLKQAPGIGLKNIESRVLAMDGTFSFHTSHGKGFECRISISSAKHLQAC